MSDIWMPCLLHRSSYLDNEWFTFETASTLVVGWDGGASRTVTRQGDTTYPSQSDPVIQQLHQMDLYDTNPYMYMTTQPSGIEAAALASVGMYLCSSRGTTLC